MPASSKYYRDSLYRLRENPDAAHDFHDQRDSFAMVYLSLIPFLVAEYVVERVYDHIPAGLIFPIGYLLFWAFFYTYYKPGFLEERLTNRPTIDPGAVLGLLMGVAIWFVKVTVVELSHLLLLRWVVTKKPSARPAGARRPTSEFTGSYNTRQAAGSAGTRQGNAGAHAHAGSASHSQAHQGRPYHETHQAQSAPKAETHGLPADLIHALDQLGLAPPTDWNAIHKRYRELAKKYHPDLNRDITEVGRRFIKVDVAYRKLAAQKEKYFASK